MNGHSEVENKLNDLTVTDLETNGKEIVSSAVEKVELFDSRIVQGIELPSDIKFKEPKSPSNPGEGLVLRALELGDYHKGFFECLRQLTNFGDVSETEFTKRFYKMKNLGNSYFVTVIEDTKTKRIIGAATLVVEFKFIHNCNKRGIIEDVIVVEDWQGQQLGKLLVVTLTQLGIEQGCYKVTLNCNDDKVGYYAKFGFKAEENNANFLMLRVPKNK